MKRRAFLATGVATLGGCLGSGSGDGSETAGVTTTVSHDIEDFETTTTEGVEVPLAPIDVAYDWHQRDAARFVDARGRRQYENAHIEGAVLSTAPDGVQDDPVAEWPTDTRIVAYCGCPHHLSSLRAATLIQNGYENVAVIDEGFWEWHDRGYPMVGENVTTTPASYEIRGQTAREYAGQSAWAFHDPTGQREAAPIAEDGSYTLELKFTGVSETSPIRVETPEYEVERTLGFLLGTVVTGSGTNRS